MGHRVQDLDFIILKIMGQSHTADRNPGFPVGAGNDKLRNNIYSSSFSAQELLQAAPGAAANWAGSVREAAGPGLPWSFRSALLFS